MNKLMKILNQRGLKQTYLAWKLGCTVGSVSSWCSGKFNPKLETAIKIAKILDTSVENIWGEDENIENRYWHI